MAVCEQRKKSFNQLVALYSKIVHWSGLDTLTGLDEKKKFRLAFLFVNILIFLVCNIYSIVVFRNDVLALVFSVVVIGFWLSGMISLYVQVGKAKDLQEHFHDIETFMCTRNENEVPEVEEVKDKYIKLNYVLSKLYIIVFISTGSCIAILPMLLNWITGSRNFIFGIVIPFVDPTTSPGFEITYGFQLIQIAYAVCGFPAFQLIYNTMVLHSCCLLEIIVVKLKVEWHRNSSENLPRLREIFQLHQLQIKSLERTQRIFGIFSVSQLFCTVVQANLTAFILIFENWLQGYILFILNVSVFFVSCLFGEFVQIKAKQLEIAIFSSANWRKFTPSEQRMLMIFLLAAQKKQHLKCGKIFILGMAVFKAVRKNIPCLS